jgi:hypothetical protein
MTARHQSEGPRPTGWPSPGPVEKAHKRYLLYRLFALVVAGGWNGFGLWYLIEPERARLSSWALVFFIPLLLPAIVVALSPFVFPFRYSSFGALERTTFPNEPPHSQFPWSYGRVGTFSATVPFFHWTVFESGLGVSILGQGKAFVPAETIETIDRGVVTHRCPEVHSPIVVPPNVAEALRIACRTTLESPKHRAARAGHDSR